jgi:hypothetical protein
MRVVFDGGCTGNTLCLGGITIGYPYVTAVGESDVGIADARLAQ